MALELVPLGRLEIHAEQSWSISEGPRGTRSVTAFRQIFWSGGPIEARSLWANGSCLATEFVAERNIRALFETTDAERVLLAYDVFALE